jgi:hypothetical protein
LKRADLIAVAREALYDPNWPVHAAVALAGKKENQRQFSHWKPNFGWWLQYREKQQAGRGSVRRGRCLVGERGGRRGSSQRGKTPWGE